MSQEPGAQQRGMVLPTALLLAGLLALMALLGANDANLELLMASNEAARQRAFEAAEGALIASSRGLQLAARDGTPRVVAGPSPLDPRVTLRTEARFAGTSRLVAGWSIGEFVASHYEIRSLATTTRGARTELAAGFARIERSDATTEPASP